MAAADGFESETREQFSRAMLAILLPLLLILSMECLARALEPVGLVTELEGTAKLSRGNQPIQRDNQNAGDRTRQTSDHVQVPSDRDAARRQPAHAGGIEHDGDR